MGILPYLTRLKKICFSAVELMHVYAPVLNACKRISPAIKTRFERDEACFIGTVETLHAQRNSFQTHLIRIQTHFHRVCNAFKLRKISLTHTASTAHNLTLFVFALITTPSDHILPSPSAFKTRALAILCSTLITSTTNLFTVTSKTAITKQRGTR